MQKFAPNIDVKTRIPVERQEQQIAKLTDPNLQKPTNIAFSSDKILPGFCYFYRYFADDGEIFKFM